jgi:hypothetical protein
MRCDFMKGRHIVAVELLDDLSDTEACKAAQILLPREKTRRGIRGVTSMVMQHPHTLSWQRRT